MSTGRHFQHGRHNTAQIQHCWLFGPYCLPPSQSIGFSGEMPLLIAMTAECQNLKKDNIKQDI
jgi:hypothetical protein